MARSLSETLIRFSSFSTKTKSIKPAYYYRLLWHRNQSSTQFHDAEALAIQKIEDAIHRIIVRRSAPDWLPFLPGSSYWVPPQRNSYGIAHIIVHKLSNSLSDDQVMSLTTLRGWPSSSSFFLQEPPADVETPPPTQLSQAEEDDKE